MRRPWLRSSGRRLVDGRRRGRAPARARARRLAAGFGARLRRGGFGAAAFGAAGFLARGLRRLPASCAAALRGGGLRRAAGLLGALAPPACSRAAGLAPRACARAAGVFAAARASRPPCGRAACGCVVCGRGLRARRSTRAGSAAPRATATRAASVSTSRRRRLTSSRTFMSSSVPRTLFAACAISSTISRVRSRVAWAPSAEAWRVRSTAERIAAMASASTPLLSFLSFLSFFLSFAIATGNSSSMSHSVSPQTIHLRPHEDVAERVLLPGDPGRALRLAQQLIDGAEDAQPPPRAVGLQRDGRRRRAADGPGHRHGRPERGDRGRGADRSSARAGCCASAPAARSSTASRSATCWRRGRARRGRGEPRARARPAPLPRGPGAARGACRRASGLIVSADLFYDPDPGARIAGARPARSRSRWRRRRCSRSPPATASPPPACCVVSDIVATRERIGADELLAAEAELGGVALAALGAVV